MGMKKIIIEMPEAFYHFLTERADVGKTALNVIKDKICELFDPVDEPDRTIHLYKEENLFKLMQGLKDPSEAFIKLDQTILSNQTGSWIADFQQLHGSIYVPCPMCGRNNFVNLSKMQSGVNLVHCPKDYGDENGKKGCNSNYALNLKLNATVTALKLTQA